MVSGRPGLFMWGGHMFGDLWRNTPTFGISIILDLVFLAADSVVFRKALFS